MIFHFLPAPYFYPNKLTKKTDLENTKKKKTTQIYCVFPSCEWGQLASWFHNQEFQEITLVNVSPPTTENKSKIRDKIKSESRLLCVCVCFKKSKCRFLVRINLLWPPKFIILLFGRNLTPWRHQDSWLVGWRRRCVNNVSASNDPQPSLSKGHGKHEAISRASLKKRGVNGEDGGHVRLRKNKTK